VQTAGVSAVLVKGNFIFDPATHRDFLGACLGTGIERSKVGDILVQGEQGAHILVVPEPVSHLEMSLTSVSIEAACLLAYISSLQFSLMWASQYPICVDTHCCANRQIASAPTHTRVSIM